MGFRFGGKHTSEFGLMFVPDSLPQGGKITRGEYTIAGEDGTVLIGRDTRAPWTLKGSLYFEGEEPASQKEIQTFLRGVLSWLQSGRQWLEPDWEDGVRYLAQMDGGAEWSEKTWMGGGLNISFTVQPYKYLKQSATVSATVQDVGQLRPVPGGSMDVPFVTVMDVTAGTLTGVTVTAPNGGKWVLEGIEVVSGETLVLVGSAPVSAYVLSGGSELPVMTYITKIEEQTVPAEGGVVTVELEWEDLGTADVSVSARGKYE